MAAVVAVADALEVVGELQAADTGIRPNFSAESCTSTSICVLNARGSLHSAHRCSCSWPVIPSPAASSAGPLRP